VRRHKISIDKVQEAFNSAIKRRDGRCMIRDFEPCCGQLECSHFFTVGSKPSLRFYPPNAYAQCQKHHFNHHNKMLPFYCEWLNNNHSADMYYMERHCNNYIKYTDELKAEIIRLCNADKLDELKELIEENLK
jgi:hypothetical protein